MARQHEVQTDLIGARIRFEAVPNEDISEKWGTIRGVYKNEDHRVMFIIELDAEGLGGSRLIDYGLAGFFRVYPRDTDK